MNVVFLHYGYIELCFMFWTCFELRRKQQCGFACNQVHLLEESQLK